MVVSQTQPPPLYSDALSLKLLNTILLLFNLVARQSKKTQAPFIHRLLCANLSAHSLHTAAMPNPYGTCNLPLLQLAKHAGLQVVAHKFFGMVVHGTYSHQNHGSPVSCRQWSLEYSSLILLSSRHVGLKCTLLHFLRPPPSKDSHLRP